MTAPERPAGRPACRARPAGASQGRGTGTPSINPLIIRAVLDHSDAHPHRATAARFGLPTRTISRWRVQRAQAAAAGAVWPSDADVAYWRERQPARAEKRAAQRSWQRRRVLANGPLLIDATGTARRLQALAALGYSLVDLAGLLGISKTRVRRLMGPASARVHRDTAAAVAASYDRLSMVPGPSPRAAVRAAALGWRPPLAWDDESIDDPAARPLRGTRRAVFDEIAVQRAMAGDPVHLRPAERAEVVRRLTALGLSAAQIAARLDITQRSVVRHRSANTRRTA